MEVVEASKWLKRARLFISDL